MPFPYQRIGRFLSSEYQTNSFEVSYSEQGLCPFADPRDFLSSSMATMNDELHFYPHCQLASYFKYFHQSRKHYQIIIKQCDLMDLILKETIQLKLRVLFSQSRERLTAKEITHWFQSCYLLLVRAILNSSSEKF